MILTTVRLLLASFLLAAPILAQQTPTNFAGEYAGMAGPYHVKLHLVAASGSISGTVDSPDAGLFGLQCADFHINGQALSFSVPNVHGSWIGTMNPDGNTLSGMWTQGAPTALNFARIGSPAAAATTAVPATPPQASLPQPATTAADCPPNSMGNYWDGSSWKPMTIANISRGGNGVSITEQLKNPLNPMAGYTTIFRYKGAEATTVVGPSPRFCLPATVNQAPIYTIGVLDVKGDARQIEVKYSDRYRDSWAPSKKKFETDVKRISDRAVEVTPKQPLAPGQYILAGGAAGSFDFGVVEGK